MSMTTARAVSWVEQGLVPDRVVRLGIRRLLKERLAEVHAADAQAAEEANQAFIEEMRRAPIALVPEKANEQHYEVPAEFFARTLGPHRKYSSRFWAEGVEDLGQAEAAALAITCEQDESDWMSRHFFSGGMMPSDDLALNFQDDLRRMKRWRWDGTHYQKTAEAWLRHMDAARDELMPLMVSTYGAAADTSWQRWRLFFMSVAELFGHADGQQWWVSHYLFAKRA